MSKLSRFLVILLSLIIPYSIYAQANEPLEIKRAWISPTQPSSQETIHFFAEVAGKEIAHVYAVYNQGNFEQENLILLAELTDPDADGLYTGEFALSSIPAGYYPKIHVVAISTREEYAFWPGILISEVVTPRTNLPGNTSGGNANLLEIKRGWISPTQPSNQETIHFFAEVTGKEVTHVYTFYNQSSSDQEDLLFLTELFDPDGDGLYTGELALPPEIPAGYYSQFHFMAINAREESAFWPGILVTKSVIDNSDSQGNTQPVNTGTNPPDLINYTFSTQQSKTLPGTSTEKVADGFDCKGIINDEDKIDRLALVVLFYQNGCYTGGVYNHNQYLVEQGVVTDTNNQHTFDAYKIYEPTVKATKFLASQHAVYYQFPTKEDYTVYRFEDGNISQILEVAASQIDTNQLTKIENLTVSRVIGSAIYLFVPSRQRVSVFTELAKDIEAARVHNSPFVDVLKYRYKVNGTPFDTRQDFSAGPNTHSNVYSRTRQFFLVQKSNKQLGIVWQDKENASIQLTWLGNQLKSQQTIKLPGRKNDFAAATYDKKGAIYYLTIQSGSGTSDNVARTATFYKVDENGQQLAKRNLDTSKEGLNMVKFGEQNIASLQYSNEKLGLILGRQMHRASDGLNHQGAIAVVLDANTLKLDKNWGQTSGHSFESFLTTNSKGEFVGIDLGDNYPRGVHLHKFTADRKNSRVVYTFKTRHGTKSTSPAGANYPVYSEISGNGVTYYKWSNDNRTYTELGGVLEEENGYTVIFAGEANSGGRALKNARVGDYLNDPRNIGLVQVIADFENASGSGSVSTNDLVRTKGVTETGGFYTFGGSWSEQRNTGIIWLTNYQNKDKENVSRLKTVKLNNGYILLFWEKWTADHYVNTYAMVVSEVGQKPVEPIKLGTHVRLNRRDDIWVMDNQVYLIAGDKNENKLELIVLQLK